MTDAHKRKQYIDSMKDRLDDLDKQIDKLEQRGEKVEQSLQQKYREQLGACRT